MWKWFLFELDFFFILIQTHTQYTKKGVEATKHKEANTKRDLLIK